MKSNEKLKSCLKQGSEKKNKKPRQDSKLITPRKTKPVLNFIYLFR